MKTSVLAQRITLPCLRQSHFFATAVLVVLVCVLAQVHGICASERQLFANPEGTVAFCFDGDTIKLTDRRIVRLAGIDSPELQHGNSKAQYFSREARDLLDQLSKGKKVRLYAATTKAKDRYGRIVAEAVLDNGQSLNEAMISEGGAFYYYHEDLLPEINERLLALQKEAIHQRAGLWQGILNSPLAKQGYIGNRVSMRFFPANCPEARRIKPRNKVPFGTLMDAFLAGYAPARICIFWPEQ